MPEKYQAYSEYKDSSVELLGEIPSGWDVLRYKNVLKIRQGMAFKSSEYVDDSSVVNIRMGNIKKGGNIDLKHNTKYLPDNYKGIYGDYELHEGDAIIAMTDMSPTLDFLAVPAILEGLDEDTSYLLNQRVGKILLDKEFDIRFIRYLLLSDELRTQLKAKGLGTVQANMSNDDLYSSYFFCPSSEERLKIVNFLNHETAKIDTLIEKQQQLIKLLKEKRHAVISHAVTKGLTTPTPPPLRDLGVEWLGEVPKHWDVVPIKRVCEVKDGTHDTPQYVDPSEDSFPLITSKDFEGNEISFVNAKYISKVDHLEIVNRSNTEVGDVLMSMIGGNIGKALIVKDNADFSIKNVALFKTVDCESLAQYILFYLQSGLLDVQISLLSRGGAQGFLSLGDLRNLVFFKMSKSELEDIVAHLNKRVIKFDNLIVKVESAIKIMQERRTALISAAVTGKIDVSHFTLENKREGSND